LTSKQERVEMLSRA